GGCGVHRSPARWVRHRGRRPRGTPVGGAAAADRVRARVAGGAQDPDSRRGDVERRRPHGAGDRARPGAAADGPHGDRDRPPLVDDQAGGADRRARARQNRRNRGSRGADRGRRALLQAVRGLGGAGRVGAYGDTPPDPPVPPPDPPPVAPPPAVPPPAAPPPAVPPDGGAGAGAGAGVVGVVAGAGVAGTVVAGATGVVVVVAEPLAAFEPEPPLAQASSP